MWLSKAVNVITSSGNPRPFEDKRTTRFISERIDALRFTKSQRDIATELGYKSPNILSMIKRGETKLPLDKIPAMAKALHADPIHLMRMALDDYLHALAAVFESIVGHSASENEREFVLTPWREATNNTDPKLTRDQVAALGRFFKSIQIDPAQLYADNKYEQRNSDPHGSE